MAIHNASDLLVYAKTTDPAKQKTRIRVLATDPIEVPDGGTTGTVKINNLTNDGGVVSDDISTAAASNTGASVLSSIAGTLTNPAYDYVDLNSGSNQTDGNYIYRDFENGANGIVPTLEIVSGTATLNEDAVIIEIVEPGSSAIFDPVAFSTSASFNVNRDLIDITNKDSGGWSESQPGLKSFEVSTESLQSINPNVPLGGTDFFNKLKEDLPTNALVDLTFSDRIRNIIKTNLTQSGVDGFLIGTGLIEQTNLQDDPFGGTTASKVAITGSATYKRLQYNVQMGRLEGKYVTWTFYVKGDPASPNNADATFFVNKNVDVTPDSFEILSGDGTIATLTTAAVKKITGLNTGANNVAANWTKVRVTYKFEGGGGGTVLPGNVLFGLCPGLGNAQVTDDIIYTSSWQIELSPEATNYQDPTDITHWQGNALVSSLSFDAGVEDNLTCSATFTGTGHIFPNGLGPELIADTGFNDSSYWTIVPSDGSLSVVEDGYGKIKSDGSSTSSEISKAALMSPVGDSYLLEYTVAISTVGGLSILDGWDSDTDPDVRIPSSVGTHKVLLKPATTGLAIKRTAADNNVWLSSISLKKVL